MAMKCMNCGKGVQYGHNVSHAKNRTRKIFQPNLHSARIVMGSVKKTVRLCTKCLRMIKKANKLATQVEKSSEASVATA